MAVSGDNFSRPNPGGEGFLLASDEDRDAVKYPVVPRTAPWAETSLAQNVSSARAEVPQLSEAMGRTDLECPGETPHEGTVLPCASPHFTDE